MPAYWLEFGLVLLGLGLMLWEAFVPNLPKESLAKAGLMGLGVIFLGLFLAEGPHKSDTAPIWGFYRVDPLSLFFKGLALLTTMSVLVMSMDYRKVLEKYLASSGDKPGAGLGEFYFLPIFACAGLMWMASACDIVSIFVSLELVTISFYVLVGFMRRNIGSLEAGVKYLILGALSTGFLVFGLSWLFGLTGETNLLKIGTQLANPASLAAKYPVALLFSLAMILVGLGFKLAVVPFQIWVPDVYQGAPTPITAFLSVGSKAAGVVVAYRVLWPFLSGPSSIIASSLIMVLATLAACSILFGNLAAIPQRNFKRLLGYSSISHAGFILLALASRGGSGESNIAGVLALYLTGYLAMTLVCFHVMCLLHAQSSGGEAVADYKALARRSPTLAAALLLALTSLAGVPFTAGFFGKFYVFLLASEAKHYVAIAVGIIGVGAGFYYYLKVAREMYWGAIKTGHETLSEEENKPDPPAVEVPLLSKCALGVLSTATIILGILPGSILGLFK